MKDLKATCEAVIKALKEMSDDDMIVSIEKAGGIFLGRFGTVQLPAEYHTLMSQWTINATDYKYEAGNREAGVAA